MVAACRELSKKKGGEAVCKDTLEDHLGVPVAQDGGSDAALATMLQPVASEAAPAPPNEGQRKALEAASRACIEDDTREGTCSLDRVTRVASVLAELQRFEGESGARFASLEARIDRFEESLSLLLGKIDRLGGELVRVDERAASVGAAVEALRRDVADVRDKVGGAESAILGALGRQPKTQCRDHVQTVMHARNELARELGVGAIDPCPPNGRERRRTITRSAVTRRGPSAVRKSSSTHGPRSRTAASFHPRRTTPGRRSSSAPCSGRSVSACGTVST